MKCEKRSFGISFPAMHDYPSKVDPLTYYNTGCGENGSVFCHANIWAIIAECILKRPEKANGYYNAPSMDIILFDVENIVTESGIKATGDEAPTQLKNSSGAITADAELV